MPGYYFANPLSIFKIWEGGMSFHGGLLGVLLALLWFAYRRKVSFFVVSDLVAPLVPFGLAFGRLGNFINGELWGRPTDLPWAMVFPMVDTIPRHPSQIYQFLGEGICLGIILWIYSSKPCWVTVFAVSWQNLRESLMPSWGSWVLVSRWVSGFLCP
jgi:phosphatidylglycerol:prolipoprotein diacylglycerol transferase